MTRLDELPFETEDASGSRRGHRRKDGKSMLTLLLVIALLGTLGGGLWFGIDKVKGIFSADDFEGDGNGQDVEIEIRDGDLLADIGNTLYNKGVVASSQAFIEAAEADPDASAIQPGFYMMQKEMSGEAAVKTLLDPEARNTSTVTVQEGWEYWKTFEALSEASDVPVEDFEALAKDPAALGVPEEWLVDGKDQPVEDATIEGFLFPETYHFKPGLSAEEILTEMVTHFVDVTTEMGFVDAVTQLDVTPHEALTVASISQAEAGNADDLPKVARVMYNRLYNEWDGCTECLQVDVTTRYGIELETGDRKGSVELTQEDLQDESNPYNTHVNQGTPPTAINSPGATALEAAMAPAEGDWNYFVATDEEGHSEFTETLDEHCSAIETAVENGVLGESSLCY
ncbi:MAG: endolytic transglycosylase MltG [Stackebrandtia sp.]